MREPMLSIVVPAYNEAGRIVNSLAAIQEYVLRKDFHIETIVVDDGSTDNTAELVSRQAGIQVLRNGRNRGKGFSVRRGVMEARGELVLFTDADLSAPIDEADKLLVAMESSHADAVVGSRALARELIGTHQSRLREMGGRLFNLLVRIFTGLNVQDTQCGFKLFRNAAAREIFERQTMAGFSFDVEDLVIARVLGYKVIEVPVVWNDVEGTKVSPWTGAASFAALAGIRWRALTGRYVR